MLANVAKIAGYLALLSTVTALGFVSLFYSWWFLPPFVAAVGVFVWVNTLDIISEGEDSTLERPQQARYSAGAR